MIPVFAFLACCLPLPPISPSSVPHLWIPNPTAQHDRHLGRKAAVVGTVLCVVGCSAVSCASPHWAPVTTHTPRRVATTKNVCRLPGDNISRPENCCSTPLGPWLVSSVRAMSAFSSPPWRAPGPPSLGAHHPTTCFIPVQTTVSVCDIGKEGPHPAPQVLPEVGVKNCLVGKSHAGAVLPGKLIWSQAPGCVSSDLVGLPACSALSKGERRHFCI